MKVSLKERLFHIFCGDKKISEFQVMPQLLNSLKADRLGKSVSRGVLVVFTCAECCRLGVGNTEEFVWKKDITNTPSRQRGDAL